MTVDSLPSVMPKGTYVIEVTAFISIKGIETLVKKDTLKKKLQHLCFKGLFLKCILTYFCHTKKLLNYS